MMEMTKNGQSEENNETLKLLYHPFVAENMLKIPFRKASYLHFENDRIYPKGIIHK